MLRQVINCVELPSRSSLWSQLSLSFLVLLERNLSDVLSKALFLFLLCRIVSSFLKYDLGSLWSLRFLTLRKCAEFSGLLEISTEEGKNLFKIPSTFLNQYGVLWEWLQHIGLHSSVFKLCDSRSLFGYLFIVEHGCYISILIFSVTKG